MGAKVWSFVVVIVVAIVVVEATPLTTAELTNAADPFTGPLVHFVDDDDVSAAADDDDVTSPRPSDPPPPSLALSLTRPSGTLGHVS